MLGFETLSPTAVRKKAVWGRKVAASIIAAFIAIPAAAQTTDITEKFDDAVREAWAAGSFSRVIMRFGTVAERDRGYKELLDKGAAVRVMDGEDSPTLNVFASPAAFGTIDYAERISFDAPVQVSATVQKRAKFVRGLGARQAKSRYSGRGTGVTVAVIDSGYNPHPDIPAARILKFKDFVDGGSTPKDTCGHGTHVAGIIAGSGAGSEGDYSGVSEDSNLVIIRVLGDDCSGKTSDVIDALDWVSKNHRAYNIKVVNLSLGHPVFEPSSTDLMVKSVQRLSEQGVVVVTAAGNMGINPTTGLPGYGGVGVPCNAPRAICVGAGDTRNTDALGDDRVTDYSSRGPSRFDFLAKPDLVATGHQVISLSAPGSMLFKNYPGLQVYGGAETEGQPAQYMTLSGTSMAAPMTAGAAAVVLGKNPRLSANTVKMIL